MRHGAHKDVRANPDAHGQIAKYDTPDATGA
jgi:hypothetical protein